MVLILVISAVLFMVVIDIFIIRGKQKSELGLANASPEVFNKNSMLSPAGYFFSKGHTWVKINNEKEIVTGVDDFVLKSLGKISILKFVNESTHIKKGDVIIEGKFDSKKISFRSPVDGIVKKVNNSLIGRYLTDPYNNDWGVIIEPDNSESFTAGLIRNGDAVEWMKNEFKKLREFLIFNQDRPKLAGVTMYDGGNVMTGAVAQLDDMSLRDFDELFLAF